jgi:tetratricopeptide (TPR) repeat protein
MRVEAGDDRGERDLCAFTALAQEYLRATDPAHFDAAVAAGERLLSACGGDALREIQVLSVLNGVLSVHCDATRDLAALARVVTNGRRILDLAVGVSPESTADLGPYWLPGLKATQARALLFWYQSSGDTKVLDEAIGLSRAAVTAIPATNPAAAGPRAALARALRLLQERTGDRDLLDEGIACLRQAPLTDEIRAALAASLRDRYRLSRRGEDLDEAVGVLRVVVSGAGTDDGREGSPLRELLAVILVLQYTHTGDLRQLDEAVDLLRAELARTPETGYDRPNVLHGLAYALAARHAAQGRLPDLAEALDLMRQALDALPNDDASRGGYLSSVGDLLRQWHQHTQEPEAIDEAITVLRAARQIAPPGGAERALSTVNLAAALSVPHQPGLDAARLDESIELLRQGLDEVPAGHLVTPGLHNNLATALLRRASRPGPTPAALADCDEAIASLESALALLGDEQAHRAALLSNLALAQYARYRGGGDRADLAAALGSAERAAAASDPPRARCLIPLAAIARQWCRVATDGSVQNAGLQALRTAVADESAPLYERVSAFRLMGEMLAADGPEAALAAYTSAVDLLPRVAPRHLRRSASEQLLSGFAGLAADAAACALLARRPERAVSLLELGRGILLSQVLDVRTDLADLRAVSPRLADRLGELREALDPDAEPAAALPSAGQAQAATLAADRRRRLAAEWDDLVAQIRERPGLAGFLRRPQLLDLLAEAREGAIALVNVSEYRCDALLLTGDGLTVVPLPTLTAEEAGGRSRALFGAVERAGQPWLGTRAQQEAEQEITAILRWLWATTAEPVLAALGMAAPLPAGTAPPRLWWSASGPLGQMPLHAAGWHADGGDRQTVLDCAVSSYTPTVAALRHARRAAALRLPDPRCALVVAMAHTPGAPDLPGADTEARMVAARFPGCRVLTEADASREAVLGGLPSAQIAHFALHGRSDPGDPSVTGLLLHDRALTIRDIARLDLPRARLAYLSACETSRPATDLTDEAVHITGAFQMAGFPEVVGTLWSVDDAAALAIATRVYEAVPGTGNGTAGPIPAALRQATLELRAGRPETPSLWAGFIHVGR